MLIYSNVGEINRYLEKIFLNNMCFIFKIIVCFGIILYFDIFLFYFNIKKVNEIYRLDIVNLSS